VPIAGEREVLMAKLYWLAMTPVFIVLSVGIGVLARYIVQYNGWFNAACAVAVFWVGRTIANMTLETVGSAKFEDEPSRYISATALNVGAVAAAIGLIAVVFVPVDRGLLNDENFLSNCKMLAIVGLAVGSLLSFIGLAYDFSTANYFDVREQRIQVCTHDWRKMDEYRGTGTKSFKCFRCGYLMDVQNASLDLPKKGMIKYQTIRFDPKI
jgi:hypothetical protein